MILMRDKLGLNRQYRVNLLFTTKSSFKIFYYAFWKISKGFPVTPPPPSERRFMEGLFKHNLCSVGFEDNLLKRKFYS